MIPPYGRKQREIQEELMNVKEESEKAGLTLNIQTANIMASGPTVSWQIDEETVETVADYFWGLQNHCMVTAAMKLNYTYSLEGKL